MVVFVRRTATGRSVVRHSGMRTATLLLVSLIGSSFALAGCDGGEKKDDKKADAKKDDKGGDAKKDDAKKDDAKKDDAKKDDAKKDGAGGGDVKLPKTGLQGTAPAGSNVSDMMGSDMVQGPGLVATVSNVEGDAVTIEKAKEDADMYGPQGLEEEKLEDGFVLTFTNKGGMGTNYWVKVNRTIDGKQFECSTTASSEEQQKAAVDFCKSLKK